MHARASIPVYILGRFCSYMYIHYTPTLQNILYTTYIAALPHMRTVEATAAIAAAVALLLLPAMPGACLASSEQQEAALAAAPACDVLVAMAAVCSSYHTGTGLS